MKPPSTRRTTSMDVVATGHAERMSADTDVHVYLREGPRTPRTVTIDGVQYHHTSQRIDRSVGWLEVRRRSLFNRDTAELPEIRNAAYAVQAAMNLRRRRADLIQIYIFDAYLPVVRRFNPDARIIVSLHDHRQITRDPEMVADNLNHADLIVACSDIMARQLAAHLPQFAERCISIPNAVDLDRFENTTDRGSPRRQRDQGPRRRPDLSREGCPSPDRRLSSRPPPVPRQVACSSSAKRPFPSSGLRIRASPIPPSAISARTGEKRTHSPRCFRHRSLPTFATGSNSSVSSTTAPWPRPCVGRISSPSPQYGMSHSDCPSSRPWRAVCRSSQPGPELSRRPLSTAKPDSSSTEAMSKDWQTRSHDLRVTPPSVDRWADGAEPEPRVNTTGIGTRTRGVPPHVNPCGWRSADAARDRFARSLWPRRNERFRSTRGAACREAR